MSHGFGFFANMGESPFVYNPVHAYTLLSTVTSSFTTNVVTLNNLGVHSGTYKHLELRMTVRSTGQSTGRTAVRAEINGGGTYHTQTFDIVSGGTGAYVSANAIELGFAPQSTFPMTAEDRANFLLRIPEAFSSNRVKPIWFQNNLQASESRHFYGVGMKSGDTNPINSITIRILDGFFSESRFSLYGIRG